MKKYQWKFLSGVNWSDIWDAGNNRTIGYHGNPTTYTVRGCSFYRDEIRYGAL